KLEVGKKYVTLDGRIARVICTDAIGDYPVVALFMRDDGTEVAQQYLADGRYQDEGTYIDLVAEYKGKVSFSMVANVLRDILQQGCFVGEPDNSCDKLEDMECFC